MNGYIAMFNGQKREIYSESLYSAKKKAIELFRPKRNQEHMIIVMLCEKDGEQVTHIPVD